MSDACSYAGSQEQSQHSHEVSKVHLDFFADMLGEKAENPHGNQNHVEDAPRILQWAEVYEMTLSGSRHVFSQMLFTNKVPQRDVEMVGMALHGT